MTANYEIAIDEMFGLFNAAWEANSAAIVGYVPDVRWPGVTRADKPPTDKFWARVSYDTVLEKQSAMGACEDERRRYEASGLLFVQLFCPLSVATAEALGKKLAMLAQNALRGKKTESGVTFFNVRINKLESEELWHRFNVVAETEYDEVA